MKSLALQIVIGAALASGFASTTQKGSKLVSDMSSHIVTTQQSLSRIDGFKKLKSDTVAADIAFRNAKDEVARLTREIKATDKPSKTMVANLGRAKRNLNLSEIALKRQSDALMAGRRSLKDAGLATHDLATQNRNLAKTYEQLSVQQTRANMLTSQRDANLSRRSEIQGKMVGATVLAATVAAPVKMAINFESSMADVKKVVNFESDDQFKMMRQDILQMSTEMPMAASGITQIYAAAGRSGMARTELKGFANDAVKMSIAFDMSADAAGSAMTGMRSIFGLTQQEVVKLGDAVNYLDNNMDATAAGIINVSERTGSMAKLIGLSGEQNAALAATFIALKTPPQVAATAMNAMMRLMATADKQGEKFQDGLAAIGWTATDLKRAIEDDAQGALVSFLDDVNGAEDKIGILTDLFGAEYSDDIAKLSGSMGKYKESIGLVGDEAKYAGSMIAEYEERTNTAGNGLALVRGSASRLAINLGTVLLPAVTLIGNALGAMADTVSFATERFPLLTTVIVTGIAALVTLRLITLANAYAMTFLKGAWLGAKIQLVGLRTWVIATNFSMKSLNVTSLITAGRFRMLAAGGMVKAFAGSLMTLARVAIPAVITGMRALSVAMLLNPIGLIVAAIAVGAFMIMKFWTPISGFFKTVWGHVQAPAMATMTVLKTLLSWSPLGLITRGWSKIPTIFKSVFSQAKNIAKFAMEALTSFLLAPIKLVEGLWNKLKGLGGQSKAAATRIVEPIKPVLKAGAATAGAALMATPAFASSLIAAPTMPLTEQADFVTLSKPSPSNGSKETVTISVAPSDSKAKPFIPPPDDRRPPPPDAYRDLHLHLTLNGVFGDKDAFARELKPVLERMMKEAKDANLYD